MNGFKRVCIVKGAAFFNDKIDGEQIDSGSLFIEEALDESKGCVFRAIPDAVPL
jgi:hypothetical protein